MQSDCSIFSDRNTVRVLGTLKVEHISDLLAHIRRIVSEARYPSLNLDFRQLDGAYGSALTILLARLKFLSANQIDIQVLEPESPRLRGQINRLNWMNLLFDTGKRTAFRAEKPLPIFAYLDADQQGHAVNCITKALLFQIPDLERAQLRSAQWAISEITDNVLNHAQSMIGGFVHCMIYHHPKLIEFVVVDAGIGIPRTLGEVDHGVALQKAISEGVTRDKVTNQGNGLYGTWRLATLSKGIFAIHSLRGNMFVRKNGSVKIESRSTNFPGTFVIFQIDYSDPNLISEALTFEGRVHVPPYDYIEQFFEAPEGIGTKIRICDHVVSTGSRESGRRLANLIGNVIRMAEDNKVEIDFDGVLIISSSFADECFGRLIAAMGPAEFFSKINFTNTDSALRAIIDRSVLQRLRLQPGGPS